VVVWRKQQATLNYEVESSNQSVFEAGGELSGLGFNELDSAKFWKITKDLLGTF